MYTCHSNLTFPDNSMWSHIFNTSFLVLDFAAAVVLAVVCELVLVIAPAGFVFLVLSLAFVLAVVLAAVSVFGIRLRSRCRYRRRRHSRIWIFVALSCRVIYQFLSISCTSK